MKLTFPWNVVRPALALTLAALLCGAPEAFAQAAQNSQQQSNSPQQQQSSQQQPAPKPSQSLDVDPSKGPLQPVTPATPENQLPSAPSAAQQTVPPAQTQKTAPPASAPQGVAVAGEAKTNGGPASQPAGTAIAPAKQRQMRSLIIKIGAIGAGAAALGAIYGLTRSTPSHPPNAASGVTQAH